MSYFTCRVEHYDVIVWNTTCLDRGLRYEVGVGHVLVELLVRSNRRGLR